jgi:hypothetical protein
LPSRRNAAFSVSPYPKTSGLPSTKIHAALQQNRQSTAEPSGHPSIGFLSQFLMISVFADGEC